MPVTLLSYHYLSTSLSLRHSSLGLSVALAHTPNQGKRAVQPHDDPETYHSTASLQGKRTLRHPRWRGLPWNLPGRPAPFLTEGQHVRRLALVWYKAKMNRPIPLSIITLHDAPHDNNDNIIFKSSFLLIYDFTTINHDSTAFLRLTSASNILRQYSTI